MDGRPTWTDCDEAGDYVVPNVLSPRDLVFRPYNMDETVPHTEQKCYDMHTGFCSNEMIATLYLFSLVKPFPVLQPEKCFPQSKTWSSYLVLSRVSSHCRVVRYHIYTE